MQRKQARLFRQKKKVILFGDSTGANFALQLGAKLKEKGVQVITILTSPLLNKDDIIPDIEGFSDGLKAQLCTVTELKDALVIASPEDEVVDQKALFVLPDKDFELLEVQDNHRLEKFTSYIPEIEKFINK